MEQLEISTRKILAANGGNQIATAMTRYNGLRIGHDGVPDSFNLKAINRRNLSTRALPLNNFDHRTLEGDWRNTSISAIVTGAPDQTAKTRGQRRQDLQETLNHILDIKGGDTSKNRSALFSNVTTIPVAAAQVPKPGDMMAIHWSHVSGNDIPPCLSTLIIFIDPVTYQSGIPKVDKAISKTVRKGLEEQKQTGLFILDKCRIFKTLKDVNVYVYPGAYICFFDDLPGHIQNGRVIDPLFSIDGAVLRDTRHATPFRLRTNVLTTLMNNNPDPFNKALTEDNGMTGITIEEFNERFTDDDFNKEMLEIGELVSVVRDYQRHLRAFSHTTPPLMRPVSRPARPNSISAADWTVIKEWPMDKAWPAMPSNEIMFTLMVVRYLHRHRLFIMANTASRRIPVNIPTSILERISHNWPSLPAQHLLAVYTAKPMADWKKPTTRERGKVVPDILDAIDSDLQTNYCNSGPATTNFNRLISGAGCPEYKPFEETEPIDMEVDIEFSEELRVNYHRRVRMHMTAQSPKMLGKLQPARLRDIVNDAFINKVFEEFGEVEPNHISNVWDATLTDEDIVHRERVDVLDVTEVGADTLIVTPDLAGLVRNTTTIAQAVPDPLAVAGGMGETIRVATPDDDDVDGMF